MQSNGRASNVERSMARWGDPAKREGIGDRRGADVKLKAET